MTARRGLGVGRGNFFGVLAGFGWHALGVSLLFACSGKVPEPSSHLAFRPVATAQPTESGAWVVDPDDPLTLYALGQRSMRSRDGGHTWSALAWPAGAQALLFAHSPKRVLYLQVGETLKAGPKLYESKDEGASWVAVGAGASDMVLLDRESGPIFFRVSGDVLLKSMDRSASWVRVALPSEPIAELGRLGRVIVSNQANPVIFVEAADFTEEFGPVVLVSTDAGASFVVKSIPGASESAFWLPRFSLDCLGRLYTPIGNSVYRSSDAATTWEIAGNVDPGATFVVAPSFGACVGEVRASGSSQSQDILWELDASGKQVSRPLPGFGDLSDLGAGRLLLTSTYSNTQRSDDGGLSWWTAGVHLSGTLAVSPARDGLLFVASSAGVSRSEDGGATWQADASQVGLSFEGLYPDPNDASVIYGHSIFGERRPYFFRSTDGGVTFEEAPVPTAIEAAVPQAVKVWASQPNALTVVTAGGVYESKDAGRSFVPISSVPPPEAILQAALGANEPPAVYAYVTDLVTREIRASLDGGRSWTSWNVGDRFVDSLLVDPVNPEVAFANVDGSNLRTQDGGKTWAPFAGPSNETDVALRFDSKPPYALYALGQHLSRVNEDGTWQTLTDLPPDIASFEFDPHSSGVQYVLGRSGLLYEARE